MNEMTLRSILTHCYFMKMQVLCFALIFKGLATSTAVRPLRSTVIAKDRNPSSPIDFELSSWLAVRQQDTNADSHALFQVNGRRASPCEQMFRAVMIPLSA